jgi:NTE family protein
MLLKHCVSRFAKFVLLLTALGLAGCASTGLSAPINQPLAAALSPTEPPALNVEGDVVALSFSGGGARAAAFAFGVLEGLREMPSAGGGSLLDRVALISAVSGGAITAAYFGENGMDGLGGFRAAYLDKDWASELHISMASPLNWARAYDGALNERDRLADWLNAEVFADGTVADLWRPGRPRVWINATDLHAGVPFAFVPAYFDALCSDLARVRIADAVAASMSVPVVFRPVVVASYGDGCKAPLPAWVAKTARDRGASELMRTTARAFESYRDATRVRFLHLVDGGVTDNFGLSALIMMRRAATTPFAPFSARDAVRVRRMTFLVVNAEQTKAESWAMTQDGPNGMETLSAAMDGAINTGKRRSYDAFRDTIAAWERDVRAYRCALPKAKAAELARGIKNWDCRNVHFAVDMISFADLDSRRGNRLASVETRVSLPADVIDELIAGGKEAVKGNAIARKITR